MKRGMTLLEVLLALALLASLVIASTSWTTLAATIGTRLERTLNTEASAEALLRLIHDAIAGGDSTQDSESEAPRVRIDEASGALLIDARADGLATEIRLEFDASRSVVAMHSGWRNERAPRDVILCAAKDATWVIDVELQELFVTLTLEDESVHSRRYVLP